MKYLYTPPAYVKMLFKDFKWNTSNNKILLTFDDGPDLLTTERILKQLNDLNIKALFFCLGLNIKNHTGLATEILKEGHIIGNHSYNHKNFKLLDKNEIINEVVSTNLLLEDKLNYSPKYFRPPFGRFPLNFNTIMKELRMTNVMWSLLSLDYRNEMKYVKFTVEKYLKRNSVIVFHDNQMGLKIIPDNIKYLYDYVSNRSYEFGDSSECLK
jgi:peptidoglycan/xylan/chitin deacetylase (PgdA/CDA1 family)